MLGTVALAVEAVAVYLQFNRSVSCAAFLERLKSGPLGTSDEVGGEVASKLRHREKIISAALQPTLGKLERAERWVLQVASRLPPDHVPLPWVRHISAVAFPALATAPPAGYPDPWERAVDRLEGLRLLLPTADERLVRIHRLVAELVRRTSAEAQQEAVLDHAEQRCRALQESWNSRD